MLNSNESAPQSPGHILRHFFSVQGSKFAQEIGNHQADRSWETCHQILSISCSIQPCDSKVLIQCKGLRLVRRNSSSFDIHYFGFLQCMCMHTISHSLSLSIYIYISLSLSISDLHTFIDSHLIHWFTMFDHCYSDICWVSCSAGSIDPAAARFNHRCRIQWQNGRCSRMLCLSLKFHSFMLHDLSPRTISEVWWATSQLATWLRSICFCTGHYPPNWQRWTDTKSLSFAWRFWINGVAYYLFLRKMRQMRRGMTWPRLHRSRRKHR